MRAEVERKEIVKRALAMLHGGPKTEQQDQQIGEPEAVSAEALAASVMAENEPDEVDSILRVWSDLFNIRLDRETVRKQLAAIRKWQSQLMNGGNQTEGNL